MEWVEGVSLEQYLKGQGRMAPELVIPLGAAIARGLATAHAQDLLHRDVKPANVLLGTDRSIKVTDFGVAEFVSRATRCEDIFGTPGYLAPECLQGEGSSTRSDLFSLGVVLYECFTGKHPFLDPNWAKTLQKTVTCDPEPVRQLNPEVPERVEEIVARLLEKDPDERPSDAAAVAEGFEQLAAEGNLRWTLGPSPQRDAGTPSDTSTRWIPPTVAEKKVSAA
jgi:serine/threonine-protein kinase